MRHDGEDETAAVLAAAAPRKVPPRVNFDER